MLRGVDNVLGPNVGVPGPGNSLAVEVRQPTSKCVIHQIAHVSNGFNDKISKNIGKPTCVARARVHSGPAR